MVEPGGGLEAARAGAGGGRPGGRSWLITISRAPIRAAHAQPDQRDRDRVAVLADRDQRLRVDARRGLLGRLELARPAAAAAARRSAASASPTRLARGRRSAARSSAKQPSSSSSLSSFSDADLGTGTRWRRRKRPTSPSTPPFSCAPSLARPRERRLVQVVRAQRDEPVLLDPAAAAQHLLDRRAQVVVADQREHAAEEARTPPRAPPGTPAASAARTRSRTPRPSSRRASGTGSTVRRCPAISTTASPQSTSASTPGSCTCGTNTSSDRLAQLTPAQRARSGAPAAPTPRPRARRRAAARPASPCAAACAAPPDPPAATPSISAPIRPQLRRRPPLRQRFRGGGNGDASACRTARR